MDDDRPNEVISLFDLFKIGIGPSSSHSVGPMVAAARFVARLKRKGLFDRVAGVAADLFGSLALTGKGHGTDTAVVLGLAGYLPHTVDPDGVEALLAQVAAAGVLSLGGERDIPFHPAADIRFRMDAFLDFHPNGMTLTATDADGAEVMVRTYYSVGGGFVVAEDQTGQRPAPNFTVDDLPYPFRSAAQLLALGKAHGLTIAEISLRNETALRGEAEVMAGIDRIWAVMGACVERGCATRGTLPGGLDVPRRAPALHAKLCAKPELAFRDPAGVLDWVNLFALAVNEENAAGGRVVTAPTNGAAGVIPAVLSYYDRIHPHSSQAGLRTFFLTAAAIGTLYKRNASISGAEVGCQGEVGVACSMAAAGLAAALGGTNAQVENAAEIGMEHNLGMTCDPVGGLVQIPCIERNAMAAVKAINAASLALKGDGTHHVSLDAVIKTMRETGRDMQSKYKETSQGGLAVNVIEC
ncbi:MAG: L-serine ammonia-lyase [Rhodobacterales bacterium]|nr:L-serine ammonia-lyase [Rhodobacterales bacterium]